MRGEKKRKAKRTDDRFLEESSLPAMTTEQIASQHFKKSKKELNEYDPEYLYDFGNKEGGKEDFENLLFMMSSPEMD